MWNVKPEDYVSVPFVEIDDGEGRIDYVNSLMRALPLFLNISREELDKESRSFKSASGHSLQDIGHDNTYPYVMDYLKSKGYKDIDENMFKSEKWLGHYVSPLFIFNQYPELTRNKLLFLSNAYAATMKNGHLYDVADSQIKTFNHLFIAE